MSLVQFLSLHIVAMLLTTAVPTNGIAICERQTGPAPQVASCAGQTSERAGAAARRREQRQRERAPWLRLRAPFISFMALCYYPDLSLDGKSVRYFLTFVADILQVLPSE